jgi:hypothetical protein
VCCNDSVDVNAMTGDENVQTMIDAWKLMMGRLPGHRIDDSAGVATARAADCPHPSMIGLCEPWLPEGWEGLATETGLGVAMRLMGMGTNSLLPARRRPGDRSSLGRHQRAGVRHGCGNDCLRHQHEPVAAG